MIDVATQIWADHICRLTDLQTGNAFLDVGGADGSLCRAVEALSGTQGTVLDPGVNATYGCYVRGVAESLPFDDERFDAVIVKHTVHLFRKPVVAIRAIARVLKRGGSLVVGTSSHRDLRVSPLSDWNPGLLDHLLRGVPDVSRICAWLKRAGFNTPDTESIETPFPGTHDDWVRGTVHIANRAWLESGCVGEPPCDAFASYIRENYKQPLGFHATLLISRRP